MNLGPLTKLGYAGWQQYRILPITKGLNFKFRGEYLTTGSNLRYE